MHTHGLIGTSQSSLSFFPLNVALDAFGGLLDAFRFSPAIEVRRQILSEQEQIRRKTAEPILTLRTGEPRVT